MAVNFQDEDKSGTEKVARNPNNYNILKGGKVDPRSKLYQRSVAGRQTLEEFVKQEWNQGKDEKDVFMSAVQSLMNRGHGYVGAYLDSKNPGRRYTQNQAMKIADEVMKNAGVGEHPGARLTSAKSDEEKASRKESRESRKASAPEAEPARKAMPVGQQRKLGKRESTGQPLEDSRREGIGEREKGPVSEWQKTLEDRMKGKASTQDVLAAFQKQYQSKLSGSPQAKEEERKAKAKDRARETAAPEEEVVSPEETGRMKADPVSISNKFKELVQDSIKAKMPIDKNSLESMIQETIEIMEDDFDVDPEEARGAILRRFNNKMIDGNRIVFDPSSAPDTTAKKTSTGPGPAPEQEKPPASEKPQPKEEQPEEAGPAKPIEGRIKQDLGTEFKSQYDTFRKGLIDSERRKTPGAWDQNKERYIQPDEAQLRDLVDLSIDEIKGRHGNIDESSARSQLRQYLVDSLGIDPYEEEETPAPAEQGKAAPREEAPEQPAAPEAEAPSPKRPVTSKGGFRAPAQPGRKTGGGGFGGGTKPDQRVVKEITDAAKQAQSVEDFKTYLYNKQPSLFGKKGFDSPDAPSEIGSSPEPQASGTMPPEAEGAGKPGQQNLFKKGTLSPRTGKGFGSKPSSPAPTQPATPGGRADRIKELMDSGMTSAAALRQMEKEGTVAPRAAKGQGGRLRGPRPEAKPTPETPNAAKTKPSPRPLDQIAKAVLSGIERDKAARESAGQFFNRVRDLIAKQAGKGADVDQAAANAINQQKGRTTRNKTTNNAEYQEFAQSIRSLMR